MAWSRNRAATKQRNNLRKKLNAAGSSASKAVSLTKTPVVRPFGLQEIFPDPGTLGTERTVGLENTRLISHQITRLPPVAWQIPVPPKQLNSLSKRLKPHSGLI